MPITIQLIYKYHNFSSSCLSIMSTGLGRFVTTGNATVEFCTNANGDVGFGTGVGGGSLRPQPTEV